MKTKLIINHPQYYLLLDLEAEIKNCLMYSAIDGILLATLKIPNLPTRGKIIAHLPKGDSPALEGVDLLPELSKNSNNNLIVLAQQFALKLGPTVGMNHLRLIKDTFIEFWEKNNKLSNNYNELIDKQITDFKHDLRECVSDYTKKRCEGAIFGLNRLKQSISTFKELEELVEFKEPIDFEVEMENVYKSTTYDQPDKIVGEQPYVINRVMQGKWIF